MGSFLQVNKRIIVRQFCARILAVEDFLYLLFHGGLLANIRLFFFNIFSKTVLSNINLKCVASKPPLKVSTSRETSVTSVSHFMDAELLHIKTSVSLHLINLKLPTVAV